MSDVCFICLEEDEDTISHCSCNLRVHDHCFSTFMKNCIKRRKDIKCTVCNYPYALEIYSVYHILTMDFSLTALTIILILQSSSTFFLTDEFSVIYNGCIMYMLFIFYMSMIFSYKKKYNTFRWWKHKVIVNEYTLTTLTHDFTVKVSDFKFIRLTNEILQLNVGSAIIHS